MHADEIHNHCVQATMEELLVLNPLTKLRTLTLSGHPDDARLDWLSLNNDIKVISSKVAAAHECCVPSVLQSFLLAGQQWCGDVAILDCKGVQVLV